MSEPRTKLDAWMSEDTTRTDAWLAKLIQRERSFITKVRRGEAMPGLLTAVRIEEVTGGRVVPSDMLKPQREAAERTPTGWLPSDSDW